MYIRYIYFFYFINQNVAQTNSTWNVICNIYEKSTIFIYNIILRN